MHNIKELSTFYTLYKKILSLVYIYKTVNHLQPKDNITYEWKTNIKNYTYHQQIQQTIHFINNLISSPQVEAW